MKLANRVVVVTGAASGIGEALAGVLAARGARLMLCDIDAERLQVVANRLGLPTSQWAVVDVADAAAVNALAAHTLAQLGGADIVINNAGVSLVAPVASATLSDAHWIMGINFWGVVHGCQAFLPQLRDQPDALLVNISSIFAMISMPTQSFYNASKAAVRGFSDALREELRGTSVGVLCVHPGGIRTRIAEQARLGDIDMVAVSPAAMQSDFARVARTSPEAAAESIVTAIERGQTRLLIGTDARVGDLLYRLFPSRVSVWFGRLSRRARKSQKAA